MFTNEAYDRLCPGCDRFRPLSAFHRHRSGSRHPRCRDCRRAERLAALGRPHAAALAREVAGV